MKKANFSEVQRKQQRPGVRGVEAGSGASRLAAARSIQLGRLRFWLSRCIGGCLPPDEPGTAADVIWPWGDSAELALLTLLAENPMDALTNIQTARGIAQRHPCRVRANPEASKAAAGLCNGSLVTQPAWRPAFPPVQLGTCLQWAKWQLLLASHRRLFRHPCSPVSATGHARMPRGTSYDYRR